MKPGTNLLHYRLIDKLGEGGMGVVWKALDTTLDREVAIKVLPDVVSHDPDRLARFEREAKLLGSLNHPNIATVHGLHQCRPSEGENELRFLAMELVAGEDLAVRLQNGPLQPEEVLAIGCQIASALEAAHSQGVVHRDLKPANIVLTPEGKAKVLDFGLAKAVDPDPGSSAGSLSLSPTITSRGTEAGTILGTAAYMSPEQARGRPVDRRADLWSFGCVLHECLTGTQLFRGETVSDSLAAILRKDPDWSDLPPDTPTMLRWVVRRCLVRDADKRLQDAGDARIELEGALEDPGASWAGFDRGTEAPAAARTRMGWLPWAVAGAALLLAAWLLVRGTATTGPEISHRLTFPAPAQTTTRFGELRTAPPMISPDGRDIVFGVQEQNRRTSLWLRSLDDYAARPLTGTEGAAFAFWSPSGREIGLFDTETIKRLEVATGRIQTIGGLSSAFPRGGSWSDNGKVLFAHNSNTGIHLLDVATGEFQQITTPDPDVPDYSHRWPEFLPDGEHFLFVAWTNDLKAQAEHAGVFLAALSAPDQAVRLLPDPSRVLYAHPGYLQVIRDGNLIAIPFDAGSRRVTGEGSVIASGVLHNRGNGYGAFSTSQEGTLVYAVGESSPPSSLAWYDRQGNPTPADGEPAGYKGLRLSPSGSRAAAVILGESGDGQIWMVDLARNVRTRFSLGSWASESPAWSGDGSQIIYSSQRTGTLDLALRRSDGAGDATARLMDGKDKVVYDWSRDGRYVAYWPLGSGDGSEDIWVYSMDEDSTEPLIAGDAIYRDARFSPDGKWVSFVTSDSGRLEAAVMQFRNHTGDLGGARWQISTNGGEHPRWREDGREMLYVDPEQYVMAVSVEAQGDKLSLGVPRKLFRIDDTIVAFDAVGDQERMLVAVRDKVESEPIHVILNWPGDL
jgi:Tol biopolymer transport system component/tRNA A-37 threonylcarbamoyl transferase component Bud32